MKNLIKEFRKKDWLFILLSLVFIVMQVWLDLKMPDYMNKITQISQGAVNPETGKAYELSEIWANGRYMLACALGSIIYMQDGYIRETGTHEELIAKDGLYANLYNSQFVVA